MRQGQSIIKIFPSLLINDLELHNEVSVLVDQAKDATEFARDWRNRHISHQDRALALDKGAQPLAATSRAQISDALSAIHAVLNRISERLLNSTLATEVITPADGAENLLYVIRDGLEADTARKARIQSRQYTQDDLRHRTL